MLLFGMRREVEIVNKLGLHARPASEFVRCAIRFKSTITICKGEESFSAASILEVLSADLDCGARVVLEAALFRLLHAARDTGVAREVESDHGNRGMYLLGSPTFSVGGRN